MCWILKLLTGYNKMQLFCILTDLLYLYSLFQKLIHSDNILNFNIQHYLSELKTILLEFNN